MASFLEGITGAGSIQKAFSGMGGMTGTLVWSILAISIVAIGLIVLFVGIRKKKTWNINVEFKLPRSLREIDGENELSGTVNSEWGKGTYDIKKGIVWIKRKGIKKIPIKAFDVKRYLQGNNVLTVVQIGVEDYRPVLPESFIQMYDEKTGEEAALIKLKVDTSESRSWRNTFERECKSAYSLSSWFRENGALVGMGIVLFMNFVGFAILYGRIAK